MSQRTTERIGFVGLGKMGTPMALNLLKAGYDVCVYDLDARAVAPFVAIGASQAFRLADVGEPGGIVVTMVPSDASLLEVALGEGGLLERLCPGGVHLSLSTISPEVSAQLVALYAERRGTFLAGTVLGSPEVAAQAALSIYLSGPAAAKERVLSLLRVLGTHVYDLGEGVAAAHVVVDWQPPQEKDAMKTATVPYAQSPLTASFQHMEADDFAQTAQAYNRLWVETGRFPRIAFPIPGPFRRFGPQMFICTSWSLAKTLMQEGTVDEHDPRSLQVLVPQGTTNRVLQFVMTAREGALSRLLVRWGIPYQYPHLALLNNDFLSFVMAAGVKHDIIRAVYATPADSEHIRTLNYEGLLAEGAARYLDDLRARYLTEGSFSTDIAITIGRATVNAAMAQLFGLPPGLLSRLVDLSRFMDQTVIPRAPHRQLQEADQAVAQACALLEAAVERNELAPEGMLMREYRRLVSDGHYTRSQWVYIALMLIRVSIENQIDSVNRLLTRFAGLPEEEQAALRGSGSVEGFTHQTMRVDPPVGFVLRWLPRTFTFETPVPGKQLVLPQGSFVLFVPRLLQSDQLVDNCGDYLLTFGYGRDQVCPGRQLGLLTVSTCSREIFRRFDLTFTEQPQMADSAFFRRIDSAPGVVTVLDPVVRVSATLQA